MNSFRIMVLPCVASVPKTISWHMITAEAPAIGSTFQAAGWIYVLHTAKCTQGNSVKDFNICVITSYQDAESSLVLG